MTHEISKDRGQRRHRAQQDERGAARPALLPAGHAARRAAEARRQKEPLLAVLRPGIGTEKDGAFATCGILMFFSSDKRKLLIFCGP